METFIGINECGPGRFISIFQRLHQTFNLVDIVGYKGFGVLLVGQLDVLFLDLGSSDLSFDFGVLYEAGRCFPRIELLSTSIHNCLWSDLIPTRPPKGQ